MAIESIHEVTIHTCFDVSIRLCIVLMPTLLSAVQMLSGMVPQTPSHLVLVSSENMPTSLPTIREMCPHFRDVSSFQRLLCTVVIRLPPCHLFPFLYIHILSLHGFIMQREMGIFSYYELHKQVSGHSHSMT